MAHKIIVTLRAQLEIEDAYDFYAMSSTVAPTDFIAEIEDAYRKLSLNPFYLIRYKNFRALPLKKFPFILIYLIEENTVVIKACFHTSKNTSKYPK